jgi:hypothetical protein
MELRVLKLLDAALISGIQSLNWQYRSVISRTDLRIATRMTILDG